MTNLVYTVQLGRFECFVEDPWEEKTELLGRQRAQKKTTSP